MSREAARFPVNVLQLVHLVAPCKFQILGVRTNRCKYQCAATRSPCCTLASSAVRRCASLCVAVRRCAILHHQTYTQRPNRFNASHPGGVLFSANEMPVCRVGPILANEMPVSRRENFLPPVCWTEHESVCPITMSLNINQNKILYYNWDRIWDQP